MSIEGDAKVDQDNDMRVMDDSFKAGDGEGDGERRSR